MKRVIIEVDDKQTTMKIYRIIGTLEYTGDAGIGIKEYGDVLIPRDRQIDEKIEADWAVTATDSFEVDGWEWRDGEVSAHLITEAMKMEADGQPTLFPLPAVKPRQLRLL